jgi:adenine-specific DNA-methyltransferase
MNTENIKEKLKNKLKEIFQIEDLDLDFGIYRIMKYKKDEIEKFIEKDLIEETKIQFNLLSEEERKNKENELEELKTKLIDLGVRDYQNNEKYQQKLKEIEQIKVSEDLERDIYNHILNFFSRYYDNGDFISQRRYGKDDKYLIPYNGEEVKLYWANYDQYYVKTTEFFKRYLFEIGDLEVNFRVVEAEEEKSNIKSPEKKFFLLNEKRFELDNNVLNIYFDYRGLTEKEEIKYGKRNVQKNVNEEICNEITNFVEKEYKKNQNLLLLTKKQNQDEKSIIEKKLCHYTRRNTSDYFIHKDLKSFLERELDFYIKTEVVNIEDVSKLDVSELQKYSLKIKVIKNIADKIIEFVSQIENFQKKLWEKKKFVLKTEYVITLDRLPEEFYEEILKNQAQLKEWEDFSFEFLPSSLRETKSRSNLKLPVDTKHFSKDFKEKLLEKLSDKDKLDDLLDGILVKSENHQALNLILGKYKEKVQTIYIDPPFNKEQDADYLYNVKYKDSTWVSLLENRLQIARNLLNDKGSIFVRCDYNGNMYVRLLMNVIFEEENFRNELQVKRMSKLGSTTGMFDVATDSIFLFSKSPKILINQIKRDRICKYCKQEKEPEWVPLEAPGDSKNDIIIINNKKFISRKNSHWTFKQELVNEMYKKGLLRINEKRSYVDKFGNKVSGLPEYLQFPYQNIDSDWTDIPGYTSIWDFSTENSEILLKRVIESTSNEGDLVMDFFLGSGTTTAVAHKLGRKWIGVEMGEHFWTVVLPRMKKVLAYNKSGISKEVKDYQGGGFFKYQYLEQYEDALENIEFKEPQQKLKFDDYLLRYILDFEAKDSQTFLNIDNMEDPFSYKLKIIEEYKQKEVNVDLSETYNYLIGLKINKVKYLKNPEDNNRQYLFITGGRNNNKVLVVWRNRKNLDPEKDKNFILKYFELNDFNEVHINGDSVLSHPNIITIEAEFKRLLFPKEI